MTLFNPCKIAVLDLMTVFAVISAAVAIVIIAAQNFITPFKLQYYCWIKTKNNYINLYM